MTDEDLIARVREALHLHTVECYGNYNDATQLTCGIDLTARTPAANEALDTLARRLDELADVLKQTVAEENTTPHHHRRAATWDDNGKPCERCLMFDRARSLLHPEPQDTEDNA